MTMIMSTSTSATAATTITHTGNLSAGTASTPIKVNPTLENRLRAAELCMRQENVIKADYTCTYMYIHASWDNLEQSLHT